MRQQIRSLSNRLLSRPDRLQTEGGNAVPVPNAGTATNVLPDALVVPAELDLDFYGGWYADLRAFDDAALVNHWQQFGVKEGRAPSFDAHLQAEGIDAAALPRDFSGEVYLKLNPSLAASGVTNAWAATLHYLTVGAAEKRDYKFDEAFYTTYYRDLVGFQGDPVDHFVRYGKGEGRVKTSTDYWTRKGLNAAELESLIEVEPFLALHIDLVGSDEYLGTVWNIVDFLVAKGLDHVRAVSADPEVSAQVYYHLGNAFISKGDRKEAEKAYLAACSFKGDHVQVLQHLADLYFTSNQHAEAIEFYRFALEAAIDSSSSFWTYYNMATAFDAVGDTRSALEYLQIARRADPNMHLARDRHESTVKREWEKFDAKARAALKVGKKAQAQALYAQANTLLDTLFEQFPVAPQPIGARPRVALVVDPYLPQCVRYRVTQKLEQFEMLGWDVERLDWPEIGQHSFAKLAFADVVVFYRVPATFDVVRLMKQCRHAGKAVVFEIDDLVFDTDLYPEALSSYGGMITAEEHLNLVRGAIMFGQALREAHYALASTKPLAERMAPLVRMEQAFLHRNGLDSFTEPYMNLPRAQRSGAPMIFYGTGTKAHNADFDDLVAPALARIMAEFPEWKLLIAGYLTLPPSLAQYEDRTVRVGFIRDVAAYLTLLSEAEINIAVLHENPVNDSKSELKWFEAGVQGIPSVVSPTRNYLDVTEPGHDVLCAANPEEWYTALRTLVVDSDLRKEMGERARLAARRYAAEAQSANLAAVFGNLAADWNARLPQLPKRPKIVIVNVFFPPQSIGGATRVVEDNVQVLLERYADQYDIEIFTSDHENPVPYVVNNYGWNGIRVTKVSTPQKAGMDWDYKNEEIGEIFSDFLDQVQPALVHFHCIQRLTASIVEVTQKREIPYLVTAHDAWWISDFQFLVDDEGKLCPSRQNDITVLAAQSKDLGKTVKRQTYLRNCLAGAKAVLAVSEAFGEIYRVNGFTNVHAVRNGVMPHAWLPRTINPSGKVRVAHIGGMSRHKGYHLFCEALETGEYTNLEAMVVDLSKPEGYSRRSTIGNVPVTFVGRVAHESISALYSQFDVLAAPSIWPESFGLVTREAVAAGCWVIASDIGAIGEDVLPGLNGFVVKAGNVAALREVLRTINENPEIYRNENHDRKVREVAEQVAELARIYGEISGKGVNVCAS
jgi:glycosyltransferase involved in cell wall biosynthesis/tetratricopeptide (TPR) repeat protein